jgi:uncharacterized repeat protein (TIGR01451 family)
MGTRRSASRVTQRCLLGLSLLLPLVNACGNHASPTVQETQPRAFQNGYFDSGTTGATPADWTVATHINNGITVATPETLADLDFANGGKNLTELLRVTGGPENTPDPNLGMTASLRYPKYGNTCVVVNFDSSDNFMTGGTNNGKNVNDMSQTMTVAAGDVDPADGLVHVRFVVAPVLQNPAHPANEQPYFFIQVNDLTTNVILYSNFNFSGQTGVPWKSINTGTANEIDYTDWQLVDVSPTSSGHPISQGDMIELQIIASGCSPGGHFGYIYVDGVGEAIPGLFVSGTGPAQANAGTDITYTVTYENGSSTTQTGVTVTFNIPPGTTYVSSNAPTGTVCTQAAGTVTCVVAAGVAAGASGSFTVTVAVDATPTTGEVTEGNYYVTSTQTTEPILGPVINTVVGCTADDQCAAGNWCDIEKADCTPTLASGTTMPTDTGHDAANPPVLNGMCNGPAATLVCTAKVCDTNNECGYENGDGTCTPSATSIICQSGVCDTDDKCGYANDDGPCTPGTNVAVCRSGVCDTDDKCGYADGDGPCTTSNPGVCRSGACSNDGKCEAAGGCAVDADCPTGDWCDESEMMCKPKLANGQAMPTDTGHMTGGMAGPVLNGMCNAAAARLVCMSGVCDSKNNECGYANGDGPCEVDGGAGDGGADNALCQSGSCGSSGVCEPMGGCERDSDCPSGKWCDESVMMCMPKLANGQSVPTDSSHTNPTLNGMCGTGVGALVCISGVCDPKNNECGYADGDGPCGGDAGGSAVCQSGICATSGSENGLCVACVMSSQCPTSAPVCNTTNDTCIQCTSSATCPSEDPVCNTTTSTCGPCNGDFGSTVTSACPTMAAPTCFATGGTDGECGLCTTDAQCTGNAAGPFCDTESGTCTTTCGSDADCTSSQWCNAAMDGGRGMCVPKLANGTSLPTTPSNVATCTAEVGTRVCISGVCDPKNNQCGLAPGDGVCTSNAQCDNGDCNTAAGTCSGTSTGADGGARDGGARDATVGDGGNLPEGDPCSNDSQCQSRFCVSNICSIVVTSGSGIFCAVQAPGESGDANGTALIGCALALAGVGARRRRRPRSV